MNLKKELTSFIAHNYSYQGEKPICGDTPITELGVVGIYSFLELLDFLQDKCSINLAEHDLTQENFSTINKIVTFIEDCLASRYVSDNLTLLSPVIPHSDPAEGSYGTTTICPTSSTTTPSSGAEIPISETPPASISTARPTAVGNP